MDEEDVPPVPTACGALSCRCVPTLRPSVEEWSDPLGYLASVRGRGELVGMVKVIVPGEGENAWEPKRYGMLAVWAFFRPVHVGTRRYTWVHVVIRRYGDIRAHSSTASLM